MVEEKSPFFVSTETIKRNIKIDEQEYEFEFKELTITEEDEINSLCLKLKKKGARSNDYEPEIDTKLWNQMMLKKSMIKAPFEINDDNLKNMKPSLRTKLLEIIKDLNEVKLETINF